MNITEAPMPLADMCDRLSALDPEMAVEVGPLEPGWFAASELADAGDDWLENSLGLMAARYHEGMDLRTRAAFLIGRYALDVAAPAVAGYLREGRVPELAPDNLALRFETYTWEENGLTGDAERLRVRLLSGRMAVLPGDPAADRDDVSVMADGDALRERFRTAFEAHLAPLVDWLSRRTRLARRALWRLAGDSVTASFLNVAEQMDDEALGRREGLAFVQAPGSPLDNPQVGYVVRSVSAPGDSRRMIRGRTVRETFRARGGCCRFYTLPHGEYCTMCVLRDPKERDRRIHEYLRGKLGGEG